MSKKEKLDAIRKYVSENYSYYEDRFWCNDGAMALLYAARDMGLKARYRFVGPRYDYSKGLGDIYYHFGSAFASGHVCTIVTIDGKEYIYEAEGYK